MYVQVVGDARAGRCPQIHAQIKARRRIDFTQSGLRALRQIHQFIRNLFGHGIELARVQKGNDHQMASDIRKEIEDNESMFGPVQNEIGLIVRCVACDLAKDAAVPL
jgi:hypothetical protein